MRQASAVRAADRKEKGENKNVRREVSWEELSPACMGSSCPEDKVRGTQRNKTSWLAMTNRSIVTLHLMYSN